jgi:hypothetical protein
MAFQLNGSGVTVKIAEGRQNVEIEHAKIRAPTSRTKLQQPKLRRLDDRGIKPPQRAPQGAQ